MLRNILIDPVSIPEKSKTYVLNEMLKTSFEGLCSARIPCIQKSKTGYIHEYETKCKKQSHDNCSTEIF